MDQHLLFLHQKESDSLTVNHRKNCERNYRKSVFFPLELTFTSLVFDKTTVNSMVVLKLIYSEDGYQPKVFFLIYGNGFR